MTLFELGTKNTFRPASGRIDVNANIFLYDYADQVFQTLVSLGSGPGGASAGFSQQNINVAQSTIQGFEIETRFDLPFGMRLDLIGSYIDAQADEGALTDTRGTDYGDGTPNFNVDIGGNDLPNVSKVNLNAHLQQTVDLFGEGGLPPAGQLSLVLLPQHLQRAAGDPIHRAAGGSGGAGGL